MANSKYASFVINVDTGEVLHDADADSIRHPASLTKMMTLYLTFEALKRGKITLKTPMKVSQRAASMPQTNLFLKAGETIKVEDAIKALVVRSANDVAVVVAEHLGKTEWDFATSMTSKARQLGMRNTVFRNANGLPDVRQITTARDMATLGIALRRDFPQYYHYFSILSFKYKGRTYPTHNRVMRDFPGADGIKTGYINMSGFNLVTSVRREGFNLVGVVLGGRTGASRDAHMKDLLTRALRELVARKGKRPRGAASSPASAPVVKGGPVPVFKPGTEAPMEDAPVPSFKPGTEAPATPVFRPDDGQASYEPEDVTVARNWGIQVGAFTDAKSAFMAAVNAVNIAERALQEAEITVLEPQAGETNVYRARISNISEGQAQLACQILTREKEPCFVLKVK